MLFNRRENNVDFKKHDLPKTRKEVFTDVFKLHFVDLIKLGLLFLLFAIPLFAAIIIKDLYTLYINEQYVSNLITIEQYKNNLLFTFYLFSALEVLGILILSFAFMGSLRIIRELCYLKPVFFNQDYLMGIKKNFKNYFISFFIIGILFFGVNLMFILDVDSFTKMLPLIISVFLILPVIYISLIMSQVYTDKYFSLLKKSFLLFTRGFGFYLLFALGFSSVFLISLIPLLIIKYVLFVVYLVFILPILLVAFVCYNNYIFDKYINKDNAKNIYKLGLYDEEKDQK
ncbi:MAG: hypothetical protein ACI31G_03895 [Bacilli bacterium]